MAKQSKTAQAAASSKKERPLSWQETRFIEEYIHNGGNGAQAAIAAQYSRLSARFIARDMLTKAHIQEAIEQEQERLKLVLRFDREDALRILIGMATGTLDDFADVLRNPEDKEAYANLGVKRYALKSAKKSYKNGNEITLVDRMQAINELWDKLGLGKASNAEDWTDGLADVLSIVERAQKRRAAQRSEEPVEGEASK